MLVWIIGIIIYGLTGLIVNSIINEGHQDSIILVILCWPLIILMFSFERKIGGIEKWINKR